MVADQMWRMLQRETVTQVAATASMGPGRGCHLIASRRRDVQSTRQCTDVPQPLRPRALSACPFGLPLDPLGNGLPRSFILCLCCMVADLAKSTIRQVLIGSGVRDSSAAVVLTWEGGSSVIAKGRQWTPKWSCALT
jgi:hypothetical protein